MNDSAVGISSQLTEVREPGVGPLDRPAEPKRTRFRGASFAWLLALPPLASTDDVSQTELTTLCPDGLGVITAVEVQGLDITEEAPRCGGLEGRCEQDGVVPIGPVGGPTDRDADPVGEQGPLPA